MKVKVIIEVEEDCRWCPYCEHQRTVGAGYALDYFCTHNKKMIRGRQIKGREIMGYVEYTSDIKPIPDWCPFREKENTHEETT